jgi:hypothetical protein
MQSASTLAQQVAHRPSIKSAPQSKPEPPPKLRQGLLDNLWLKMTEMYGHRWTGSFGVSADQSHAWAATLGGLTGAQIANGLAALVARGDEWPPSAPDFRNLCAGSSPEALGLPEMDRAYREACRNAHPAAEPHWSHVAVHHAACEAGFYELRTLPEEKSRRLFERAYAITVRMLLAGEPLREIPKALPASASTRTPEVGRNALAGLRASLRRQETTHA